MKLAIIEPLREKQGIKVFVIAAIFILLLYVLFSVLLVYVTLTPKPTTFFYGLLFAALKNFSTFARADWIIFFLFPLAGALLWTNYRYYRCQNVAGHTGLFVGLLAAVCPVCVLPLIGAASFFTALTAVSIYIKVGALLLILGSTYVIAQRKQCRIPKR